MMSNNSFSMQEATTLALERLMAKLNMTKSDASAALQVGNSTQDESTQSLVKELLERNQSLPYVSHFGSDKFLAEESAKTILNLKSTLEKLPSASQ